ncbi:MAG: ATP-grasp domain-containing protein [Acidobacteriota bacterium]
MNVLFLSPGFPSEMPLFARALASIGARVVGVGDHPKETLPDDLKAVLSNYLRVPSIVDEDAVVRTVVEETRQAGVTYDRIEGPWEPMVLLAAKLREALGVPGMDVTTAERFRDKELMKQALDEAGLRTPRHARCTTEDEAREAAERIGYPLILKPIAGAGSADTHRVENERELEEALLATRHVRELSVEEYIDGEEYTFDTVCAQGEPLFHNISWYRPRPLLQRTLEWCSPMTIAIRHVDAPELAPGVKLGLGVLSALGMESGFTHMEWFLTSEGEAVFGEIGARPPGARSVDVMNYANDIDLFVTWAEAVCFGKTSLQLDRKNNCAIVFKRARGQGRITSIEGLPGLMARYGEHVVQVDLLPVGAPRRNWKQTLMSDGHVIVRHPDFRSVVEITDAVARDLRLTAE